MLDVGYLGLDTHARRLAGRASCPGVVADGRRYELGLPSLPALVAAHGRASSCCSTSASTASSPSRSASSRARIEGLAERGRGDDILTPLDPAQRAGVIALRSDDPVAEFERCRRVGVDIGAIIGSLRIDPHGYNDDDDIDRLLACF